jgi:hypothetical protein
MLCVPQNAGNCLDLLRKLLASQGHRSMKLDAGPNTDLGRAITQAVSSLLPTAAARVRAQVKSCGICGGQSGVWGRFSPSTSVSPANHHSTNFFSTITITYHPGLVQLTSSGRSTQSPTAQIKKKIKQVSKIVILQSVGADSRRIINIAEVPHGKT